MQDQDGQLTELFRDTLTSLPHHVLLFPTLEQHLRNDSCLGLIVVNIEGLDSIEETLGDRTYSEIVREIGTCLYGMKGSAIREDDLLATSELGGSSFMIFLTNSGKTQGKRKHNLQRADVDIVANRVRDVLFTKLLSILHKHQKGLPQLSVGRSYVVYNPLGRKRRLINKLIEEGRESARRNRPGVEDKYKNMLEKIIMNREIRTVFQPIFSMASGKAMGAEALARGPKGTIFESPLMLFSVAEEVGLIYELDRLCREQSLCASQHIANAARIFVNTLPRGLQDPDFQGNHLDELLVKIGRNTNSIVFEITEREAIINFSAFQTALAPFLSRGVSFAVDDIGSGYSSFDTVVKLQPHFMKLDMSMVQGIATDPLKQDMVRMLNGVAKRINSGIVAEGIETQDDYEALKEIGVAYAQGFYLARPMPAEELKSF